MVKLLLGGKGAGKTKEMIAFANDKVEVKKGDIVFINKNDRLNFDLKYDIRLISMIEYPYIENIDGFIGFLYGIQSGNSDIESIYRWNPKICRHQHREYSHVLGKVEYFIRKQ